MRSRALDSDSRRAMILCAVLLLLLLTGCASTAPSPTSDAAIADRLEKLPTLPADVAKTLDPKTHATKTSGPPAAPVKSPEPLPLAPCCSIKDQKELKVNVPLTVCGPLWNFVLAPIGDLVMARDVPGAGGGGGGAVPGGPAGGTRAPASNVRLYKLNDTVERARLWDQWVCVTGNGPWDATFIENHYCAGYGSQDSLFVSAWGSLFQWNWSGGVANHPPEVTVVSCNDDGTFRLPCGGLGSCDCTSSPCMNPPCPCPAPW